MAVVFVLYFQGDAALKLGFFRALAVIKSQVLLPRLVACHRHRLADDPVSRAGLPARRRWLYGDHQAGRKASCHSYAVPARGFLAYRDNTRRVVG